MSSGAEGSSQAQKARARVERLLDDNSFIELKSHVDCGVITGYGATEGRLVFVYSQYGSVNPRHGEKITALYEQALRMGAPVVAFLDSSGMEIQDALESLAAYGWIYDVMGECSGIVPQIAVVMGGCLGAAAYLPALSDFVIMTEKDASIMLQSPAILKDPEAKRHTLESFSGSKIHGAETGLCHFSVKDENGAVELLKELLPYLPSNNLDEAPIGLFVDDYNREEESLSHERNPHAIIKSAVDGNAFLESQKDYETTVITGFARFNGVSAGILANNGPLTPGGAQKAADFIKFCDAFTIPLVSITSASGYEYSSGEQGAMLKAGAALLHSLSSATTSKINVITGPSFGSPHALFNSFGADITYIWQGAEIAAADPVSARKVLGTELDASAENAARLGFCDNVIDPASTRKMIIAAVEMLNSKRVVRPAKKRGSRG